MDDIEHFLGRAVRLRQTFGGAGFPGILNQIGKVSVGKHHDGHATEGRVGANGPDYFDPAHVGQNEIEHDEVRFESVHGFQARLAVLFDLNFVTVHGELVAVDVADNLVVFDDQNFFHAGYGA